MSLWTGDVGVRIVLTLQDEAAQARDISAATTLEIHMQKPDGTVSTETATLTNTGTDGKLEFSTASGDLDQSGTYQFQAHVVDGSLDYSSSIHSVFVGESLA